MHSCSFPGWGGGDVIWLLSQKKKNTGNPISSKTAYQVSCIIDAGNIQLPLKRKLKEIQDKIFICKTLLLFYSKWKEKKRKKQSKWPLYWNCIVTHCPFHADVHLLWTEPIMSNLSLSHFLKGMYLFSSIPRAGSLAGSPASTLPGSPSPSGGRTEKSLQDFHTGLLWFLQLQHHC